MKYNHIELEADIKTKVVFETSPVLTWSGTRQLCLCR